MVPRTLLGLYHYSAEPASVLSGLAASVRGAPEAQRASRALSIRWQETVVTPMPERLMPEPGDRLKAAKAIVPEAAKAAAEEAAKATVPGAAKAAAEQAVKAAAQEAAKAARQLKHKAATQWDDKLSKQTKAQACQEVPRPAGLRPAPKAKISLSNSPTSQGLVAGS
eukprot:353752-Chlamydomonas_euryale.AAC.2